ncbi:MAG: thiamine phosphate synthase [Pseudomonadota bacterium]
MTDPERAPDAHTILAALPKGSGLVWRAYDTVLTRHALRALERHASKKKIMLLIASMPSDARKLRFHHRHFAGHRVKTTYTDQFTTAAAHSEKEIIAAARAGIDAVLISPVFATVSHKDAKPLGALRFADLARIARTKNLVVYALGGVTDENKIRRLKGSGLTGIAGIGLFVQA